MPRPTGPTTPIKFAKSIARLPTTLTANTLYAVRSGAGMDLYVSDMTGAIAYKTNASEGGGGSSLRLSTLNVSNQEIDYVDNVSNLSFDVTSGFSLTDLGNGQVKVSVASGNSYVPLKTFNIIGDFGLLTGTARYIPAYADTIRSAIISTGAMATQDIMAGLYRNGEFVSFFIIPAGQYSNTYNDINISILATEFYTVNIVGGQGTNLSLALYNTRVE